MKRRMFSMLLAFVMVIGAFPALSVTADASGGTALSSGEAVAEMTWGVNLADLYMAEPTEDLRRSESSTGYVDYVPQKEYDLCVGIWFWDNSF